MNEVTRQQVADIITDWTRDLALYKLYMDDSSGDWWESRETDENYPIAIVHEDLIESVSDVVANAADEALFDTTKETYEEIRKITWLDAVSRHIHDEDGDCPRCESPHGRCVC